MGIANDFMNSFFAAYPEARSGKLRMEELNWLMAEYQRKVNSSPLNDFDGLSPEQMSGLLYTPLAPGSIIQFRKDMNAHVHKAPFFKLSEILLHEIQQAGSMKLTVTGNLPVRVCELLYSQNLIYTQIMKFVKRMREDEVPFLWPLKQYLLDSGMVKKRNNALSLTKSGEKLLAGPEMDRFIQIFDYMVNRFHWGNLYELQDEGKTGQLGWAYSLILLSKYGDKPRESRFYSFKLMQAFEKALWDGHQKGEAGIEEEFFYHRAYEMRFFECFANWFGLVDIARKQDYSMSIFDQLTITRSDLFDQLFEVKIGK